MTSDTYLPVTLVLTATLLKDCDFCVSLEECSLMTFLSSLVGVDRYFFILHTSYYLAVSSLLTAARFELYLLHPISYFPGLFEPFSTEYFLTQAPILFFFPFFFPFFFITLNIFALSTLSLLVVTQLRGHMTGSFPPLATTVRALHFYRDKISALSTL